MLDDGVTTMTYLLFLALQGCVTYPSLCSGKWKNLKENFTIIFKENNI